VDEEDLPRVQFIRWYRHQQGYAVGYLPVSRRGAADNRLILMHRFILGEAKGLTDHKNGNRLDNRKCNLRRTDDFGNGRNVSVRRTKGKTSKFKGVCWHSQNSKWMVRVAAKYIGLYADEIDAAKAYNVAAQKFFGEYAKLNKID